MSSPKTAVISRQSSARRSFIKQVLATGAAVSASSAFAGRVAATMSQARGIVALDHVAIPIQNVEEMVSFYRELGFGVREAGQIVSIHFGDQKINFHRPSLWQSGTFTLRAAAALRHRAAAWSAPKIWASSFCAFFDRRPFDERSRTGARATARAAGAFMSAHSCAHSATP